ncbi:P-loop containing nucleoside triphosphate hydrolase [Phytophthora cactorum]|nr:P-loop containing nucleoside triphosphate hydrolase [Phytophthora cactorum]
MAPITLLKKGSLVARMGENQAQLDNIVPIDYIMSWFDMRIDNRTASDMSDRVVVLLSKTGSGRSTSIATNLYLRFFKRYRSNIIITQPRQLTATEIPKDIAGIEDYRRPNDNGLTIELYRNLGYQTMEFVKKPTEEGILFCTTGILLQYLKNMPEDQFCRRFRFVIIDEAHDRALDVDLILMLMKRLIKSRLNNGAPFFIVMSATLNVQRFSKYLNTRTVFEVSGQSKPIDVIYPSVDVGDITLKHAKSWKI